MYENIINLLFIFTLFYIIFNSYLEYKKELEFKKQHITNHNELEDKLIECQNSNLYHIYNSLSDEDKKFLDIYINYSRIKQKSEKPKYKKLYNGIKNQLLYGTVLTVILTGNFSAIIPVLRQNTFQQFGNNFL